MIIDELIFDRTNEDIEKAKQYVRDNVPFPNDNLRFSWDYRALNRTEQAMEYVDKIFKELGYYRNMKFKTDWLNDEITRDEANRYIENLTALRNFILMPSDSPSVPTTMNGMTIEKANDIEKLIFDINFVIEALKKNLIRSGVATCGQTRMWQQRYRTYGIEKIEEDEEGGEVIPPETPEENKIKYIEYLESTGTQYIDTEIYPYKTKVEVTFQMPKKSSTSYVLASWNANNERYYPVAYSSTENDFRTANRLNTYTKLGAYDGLIHTVIYNDEGNRVYYDNVLKATVTDLTIKAQNSIYLFAMHGSTGAESYFAGRIMNVKITDKTTSTLLRDFRPVLDESGVACLYDEVEKKYYYNAGTGDFVAGDIIKPIQYVEYIESNGTQYIDTEVKGSQNTKIELKYSDDGKSSVVFYCGARGNAYNRTALFMARNSATTISVNQAYSGEILGNHGGVATVSIGTSQHTQVLDKGKWYYDGVQLPSTPISTNFTTPYTLRIFGSCNNGTMSALASIKLYSCKIYENDVLVRDLRPALDENDVACLYDEVSKTYFYNAGSGNFLAGAIL